MRRDALTQLKELEKDGEVGTDDVRRAEDRMQKLTDEHVKTVDDLFKSKESEILEV